jgi:hypothetical protein
MIEIQPIYFGFRQSDRFLEVVLHPLLWMLTLPEIEITLVDIGGAFRVKKT